MCTRTYSRERILEAALSECDGPLESMEDALVELTRVQVLLEEGRTEAAAARAAEFRSRLVAAVRAKAQASPAP